MVIAPQLFSNKGAKKTGGLVVHVSSDSQITNSMGQIMDWFIAIPTRKKESDFSNPPGFIPDLFAQPFNLKIGAHFTRQFFKEQKGNPSPPLPSKL
ncbi:unnamed protein product [Linum trigynum]|uniref:Uncharacterized protein n=1 Tax=Linum trigynum TaxID=586398 RepID=A0AAV2CZC6_9ROSI